MKKFLPITLFIFLFGQIFSKDLQATTPLMSNIPSTVTIGQEFAVDVSFSNLSSNKIYRLRIAFFEEGETKYFGEIWNGNQWYSAESPIDYSKFYSVTTDADGAWTGQVKGKVSYGIQNFEGTLKTYNFKIGRYTETGTSATWSETISVQINDPNPPTPTATPTCTPNPISTNTPTPKPAKIPTPTKPPAQAPVKNSNIPTPTVNQEKIISASIKIGDVLGETNKEATARINAILISTDSSPLLTEATVVSEINPNTSKPIKTKLTLLISFFGGILLTIAGVLIFFKKRRDNVI